MEESYALLDALFASAPVGIGLIDREMRYVRVNETLAAFNGKPAGEHLGRTIREMLPELADELEPLFRRALDLNEPIIKAEVSGGTAAAPGEPRHWIISVYPARSHDELLGAGVVMVDITGRKRAEEHSRFMAEASELLNSSLEHEVIFSHLARLAVPRLADWCAIEEAEGGEIRLIAVAHVDPEKVRRGWELRRRYMEKLDTPYGVFEVIRTGEPLLFPEIPDSVLVEGAQGDEELLRILRELGMKSAMVVPLVYRGKALGGITLVSAESGRRYTERDLEFVGELARRAAAAIANARLFAAERRTTDRLTRLQRITAALVEMLSPAEMSERVVREGVQALGAAAGVVVLMGESGREHQYLGAVGVPPAASDLWQRRSMEEPTPASDALLSGNPVFIETPEVWEQRYPLAARQPLWPAGARAIVPLVAGERVFGVVAFGFTGPRAFCEEDRAFVLALARQCSSAFERARLFEETQGAIRLRDEFLAIASHELRTPLTALKLQLQSAQRLVGKAVHGEAGDKLASHLVKAGGHTGRLTKLIDELLDVSRITSGRLPLTLEQVDLSALAKEVCGRFPDERSRGGAPLRLHTPGPVRGRWDRMRVDQVITHLLANALKYGQGKPVEVTVEQDGPIARLIVRDQGIGIAPEDQARIFGRFERAVSQRHYGGFGLGLWMVRRVVEALGGGIRVESRPNAGSSFIVELPQAGPGPEAEAREGR